MRQGRYSCLDPGARFVVLVLMLVGALGAFGVPAAVVATILASGTAMAQATSIPFVKASGTSFTAADQPFFVAGVNNHYLTYASPAEVTRVLDDAVALGANVVRTMLQPVIGAPDGSVPTIWDWKSRADASNLGVNGAYLLYWNAAAGRPAVNDGKNGMQKVDFLLAEAKKRKLKLLISFLDFWAYTGGAQQMRAWYGSADKNTFFFADARTQRDYRNWIEYVVNRRNAITGVRYKDDPTIFGWDLMNEGNAEPASLRQQWIAEMSAFVKSQDSNHLVGSGAANVDGSIPELAIPTVDFGTWHGYPLFFNVSVSQFDRLIGRYCTLAADRQKPVLLEEFGYARSNSDQTEAYGRWLRTLGEDPNCAGWLAWRLVARQDSGEYPKDEHDKFDLHNDGSATWNVVKAAVAGTAAMRSTARAIASRNRTPATAGQRP